MCIRDSTYTYKGIYLSLRGVVNANNSVIPITEIRETNTSMSPPQNSNNGLQCITDRMPCCRFGHRAGEWFFPNGTMVPEGSGPTFYRNRGRDDGTVNLNRVNTNVMSPTGLFCCNVDHSQWICALISKLIGLVKSYILL